MIEKELNIYTALEDAKIEIKRRWNDKALRKKVEYFLNEKFPIVLKNEPRAVLFRQVMTPDIECGRFLELSKEVNLKPLGWEYLEDKFSTRNHDKIGLCKMAFFYGKDKNGNNVIQHQKIINIPKSDNKKFREIETLEGENFVDFHHRILKSNLAEFEIFDASDWFKLFGSAGDYYEYFLALFVCHGVLFENFITDESEREFAEKVVYPAFEKIKKKLGVVPLIVALAPNNESSDEYWWCYPEDVREKEILRIQN